MNNKQFLEKHPLQFSLPLKETKALRKILKKANEGHVLISTEEKGVMVGKLQYYDTSITCGTTNFAHSYWYFGLLYAESVLPIWEARHKKK